MKKKTLTFSPQPELEHLSTFVHKWGWNQGSARPAPYRLSHPLWTLREDSYHNLGRAAIHRVAQFFLLYVVPRSNAWECLLLDSNRKIQNRHCTTGDPGSHSFAATPRRCCVWRVLIFVFLVDKLNLKNNKTIPWVEGGGSSVCRVLASVVRVPESKPGWCWWVWWASRSGVHLLLWTSQMK